MKCNPLRWLWGIPLLLPLVLLAVMSSRSSVEADIKARAQDSLKRAGFNWAEVVMDGRDAVVTGKAVDETEPDKALKVVDAVWGVRGVSNAASLIEKVDKYVWGARRTGNKIRLSGYVPSEKARLDVHGMIKGTFPGLQVEDQMKLARGAPPADVWLGGVGFGLKQLAQLKSGDVDLEQTSLSVSGEANDAPAYSGVRKALASNMPKGVQLKADAVRPPMVKPYTWAAKVAGDKLLLSGFVPDDKVREAVLATARRALPKAQVTDTMQLGDGAPAGFAGAVESVLAEFHNMDEAHAEFRDTSASVAGLAENVERSGNIRAALKRGIPASFKVSDQIRHREPTVKTASPYGTTAQLEGGNVVLTGFVPSDEARKSVTAFAQQHFKGRTVQDRMETALGQPPGWQRCVESGIVALERMGNGRAALIDRRLDVTGATESETLAHGLPVDVRTSVGRDCDADVRLTLNLKPEVPRPDPARAEAARAETEANRLKMEAEARAKAEAVAAAAAAKGKADADARAHAEAEAKQKAAADEAARVKLAAEARQKQAVSCQETLRTVMKDGVINFQRASATIEATSFATLNKLAEVANKCPDVAIDVEGHTDAEGTPERNQALSERRARSVVDYLVRAGVVAGRLHPIGYGQTRNIARNETPEDRAKNRRIEFNVK